MICNIKSVYLTTGHNFVGFDVDPFYGAAGGFKKLEVIIYRPRMEKTCLWGFPSKRVSNQSLQLQRLARKLKFPS